MLLLLKRNTEQSHTCQLRSKSTAFNGAYFQQCVERIVAVMYLQWQQFHGDHHHRNHGNNMSKGLVGIFYMYIPLSIHTFF